MEPRSVREPVYADVVRAAEIVREHLGETPVIESAALGVHLKLETFQPTGSFKVRGALAAVARARQDDRRGRVITASAGNHGLGVAYAARTLGMSASIVVPESVSEAKLRALKRLSDENVEVILHGAGYDEAERYALSLPGHFVSAYNDPDVIAGQGSIALELFDQVPDVATIVAPVGGGGLLSGVALASSPKHAVHVVGVEAEASPAVSKSVAAGRVVEVMEEPTIADGLAGNIEAGSVTIPLASRYVEDIFSVSEVSLRKAIAFLATEHGLVTEASGAAGVAAVADGHLDASARPVVVIVSGRNIATALMAEILAQQP
jgi:threonine dehydratase